MTTDPRMQLVQDNLSTSYMARTVDREIAYLQLAMTELAKVVETVLPEPDPEPTPEDLAAMEAAGIESFEDARAKLFSVNVEHPSVARIKFANGGIVSPNSRYGRNLSDQALLQMRLAIIEQKNKHIETLEARIANQRKELDHLNAGRSLRNKELEARIEELELLTKAPASAIDQLREELSGKLLDFFQKSA